MRRCCCLILGIFIQSATWAQSLDSLLSEINDLSTVEQPAEESFDPLEDIARNPWNIQTVQRDDLVRIPWLSPQQVQAFFLYRERFSGFQTLYELQAIPGWDILTIRKTLPLLRWESLTNHHWIKDERNRQEILIRWTQSFTNYREGTTSSSSAKLGPSFRNLIRYKLRYNQHVDAGILAEKDPGEPFFRQNKWGYDFYSAHLFFHGNRFIKKWILGDYIVNMGQGLIQWQGFSLSPSFEPVSVYKQAPAIAPYRGADEFQFHRGLAITMGWKRWECTLFASQRKLDAYTDILNEQEVITSVKTDGYHDTQSAFNKKGNLKLTSFGTVLSWQQKQGSISFNMVRSNFNKSWEHPSDWYQLNKINSNQSLLLGTNWTISKKNTSVFGEISLSLQQKNIKRAGMMGMLLSLSRQSSFRIVLRYLQSGYQSIYSNALAQQSQNENESGLMAGFSTQIKKWKIDGWGDVFANQWIRLNKFSVEPDAVWQTRLMYQMSKSETISASISLKIKHLNQASELGSGAPPIRLSEKTQALHVRLHYSRKITATTTCNVRVEWSSWKAQNKNESVLAFLDMKSRINAALTLQCRFSAFEGNEYDARIYAFEPDLTYSSRISPFFQSCLDFYILLKWKFHRNWQLDGKIRKTKYIDNQYNRFQISANTKQSRIDFGAQVIYHF